MIKRDLYYERIPTKLLRDDVRYLGNILGKVIKVQRCVTTSASNGMIPNKLIDRKVNLTLDKVTGLLTGLFFLF